MQLGSPRTRRHRGGAINQPRRPEGAPAKMHARAGQNIVAGRARQRNPDHSAGQADESAEKRAGDAAFKRLAPWTARLVTQLPSGSTGEHHPGAPTFEPLAREIRIEQIPASAVR